MFKTEKKKIPPQSDVTDLAVFCGGKGGSLSSSDRIELIINLQWTVICRIPLRWAAHETFSYGKKKKKHETQSRRIRWRLDHHSSKRNNCLKARVFRLRIDGPTVAHPQLVVSPAEVYVLPPFSFGLTVPFSV